MMEKTIKEIGTEIIKIDLINKLTTTLAELIKKGKWLNNNKLTKQNFTTNILMIFR